VVKVIFLEDVKGTANAGETKDVADGFARNYLLPRRLAVPASRQHLEDLRRRGAAQMARVSKDLEEARALATRIEAARLVLLVKAGSTGKLYGSVTNTDVAEALEREGISVDRRKIVFKETVRALGDHPVEVRLHPKVVAYLTVGVEAK